MKEIRTEQLLLLIASVFYILDISFLGGRMADVGSFLVATVLGVIALISAMIQAQYKWMIVDGLICLFCTGIAIYLVGM